MSGVRGPTLAEPPGKLAGGGGAAAAPGGWARQGPDEPGNTGRSPLAWFVLPTLRRNVLRMSGLRTMSPTLRNRPYTPARDSAAARFPVSMDSRSWE